MKASNSIFDIIILFGAIQGFIISALLYFKKENLYANKILAALIFLISLACLNIYLLEIGIQDSSSFWRIFSLVVPLVIVMPIGPLIYFYLQSTIVNDFKIKSDQRIHFYPVLLDLFPSGVGIVFVACAYLGWIPRNNFNTWGSFLDNYRTYVDVPRWCSVSIYTWLAWRKLKEFERIETSSLLVWPKQFIYVFTIFQLIWLLHLIPYTTPSLSQALLDWVSWYPIYVPMAIMIYWLGIKGYSISRPKNIKKSKSVNLDPEKVNEAFKSLEKAMREDRIFLNPALSLDEVVSHTGLTQKTISSVLNQYEGKSFNEFINEYRIDEVKKRLLSPGNGHLTITGIAFECGFNSQATFQRTFKQFTNQSPREFQLSHQEKSLKNAQI